VTVDVCFSPALYPRYHDADGIVIVADIFRATTTIITAFMNGARSIRPVASIDEAISAKADGFLVGAERNVRRCDFADFGNSPFDYTPSRVCNRDIVFTTTNGTRAVVMAAGSWRIAAGAFVNLQSAARWCAGHGRSVVMLASGWNDKINLEDTLYGGALVAALMEYSYRPATDAARMALDLWNLHRCGLKEAIAATDHYARLLANGLEDSVDYCLSLDVAPIVPEVHGGAFRVMSGVGGRS
jgi:2-phosphosulfolactate phosphatase